MTDGGLFPLVPDRVVVIPEDVRFDCIGEEGTPHLWLHFAAVGTAAPPLDGVHAIYLLHASFTHIDTPLFRPYPEPVEKVLSFVQEALGSPLSVSTLARRAGMSVAHFSRWFEQNTGSTPADFIIRSRVRRVRQLLVLSDASLDQIAADIGFPNRFPQSVSHEPRVQEDRRVRPGHVSTSTRPRMMRIKTAHLSVHSPADLMPPGLGFGDMSTDPTNSECLPMSSSRACARPSVTRHVECVP